MKKAHKISAALIAAMTLTTATTKAHADNNLAAFAVGAAVGALVNHQINKNRQQQAQQQARQQQAQQPTQRADTYTRAQNREVQEALNAFGFNAGPVDGALGRKSRSAISEYQGFMGYPVSGYLEDYQRTNLVSSHQQMQAGGGSLYPNVVANEGSRGLLKAFTDPSYAARYNAAGEGTASSGALAPLALTEAKTGDSMLRYCDMVDSKTRANNGPIKVSNLSDPNQALGEQFCAARDYAIDQLNALSSVAEVDSAELATACNQITDALADVTARVGTAGVREITADARSVVDELAGGDMETATGYGQLCLGLGYTEDDPKMALTGALVLLSTDKPAYAEYVGHHLRWGFGVDSAPLQAATWYNSALSAMAQGASPVVLPAESFARNSVINAAVNRAPMPIPASASSGSLPKLNLSGN